MNLVACIVAIISFGCSSVGDVLVTNANGDADGDVDGDIDDVADGDVDGDDNGGRDGETEAVDCGAELIWEGNYEITTPEHGHGAWPRG